jgi:hypothetical protein
MQNVDFLEGFLNEYGKRLVSDNAIPYFASLKS